MNVRNSPGKDGSNIQELDLAAGSVANLGDGIQEYHFLNGACLDPLISGAGQNTVGSHLILITNFGCIFNLYLLGMIN